MGILDELASVNLDGIEVENPDAIKTGTYPVLISGYDVKPTKNGDKVGITVKFFIDGDRCDEDQEEYAGRKFQMWQQIPTKEVVSEHMAGNKNATRTIYYFKQFMDALGLDSSGGLSEDTFEALEDMEALANIKAPAAGEQFANVRSLRKDAE